MATTTNSNLGLCSQQFENANKLIGQTIKHVVFYLESSDRDFTEQPNEFGKSLLNGIDVQTTEQTFSIGNRYSDLGYGLSIDIGRTIELENFDEVKIPTHFVTQIVGQKIKQVNIYWMNIPFENEKGIYPQEIEIITDNGYLLLSSIEVNDGEIDTEFTDELLILDNQAAARRLRLGQFGLLDNNRKLYKDLNDLAENEKKNGL